MIWKECVAIYHTVEHVLGDATAAKEVKAALRKIFPIATCFMEQSEIEEQRKAREAAEKEQQEEKKEEKKEDEKK